MDTSEIKIVITDEQGKIHTLEGGMLYVLHVNPDEQNGGVCCSQSLVGSANMNAHIALMETLSKAPEYVLKILQDAGYGGEVAADLLKSLIE